MSNRRQIVLIVVLVIALLISVVLGFVSAQRTRDIERQQIAISVHRDEQITQLQASICELGNKLGVSITGC